jgi:hypothetical protein
VIVFLGKLVCPSFWLQLHLLFFTTEVTGLKNHHENQLGGFGVDSNTRSTLIVTSVGQF